ncbi:ABC transporter substrate-binding protein [Parathalassolituus penaei]|uniref:Probable sugar-binding periplasmic protein n=1 Tax=Parathalassolituus penaei TaxID=2997323 RepID=A0A9X3ECE8_9GAMM|nr:ABC transporter substrate-binding protein [Parathalassolituus penaei]MCY0965043.1 ABC transporter substrate-binding protein [Parathalassolituus penaei]
MNRIKALAGAISLALSASFVQAGEVEVLHYMTSSGEAAAVNVLKQELEKEGHTWKDFAVAGGGGETAMTVLKSRAVSGNPPAAAQIKGLDIQEWGEMGFLTNLDKVAAAGHWDNLLPPVVSNIMKYEDHYVAVPVNVHRVNWLWANPAVFKQAGVEVPTTWNDFFTAAEALKAKGIIPLAHGGQPWQDATLFEAVALGVGGSEFYRKAFVEHDAATLGGDTMVKVLETFKKTRDYIDADAPGRDWNIATSMVINGKAAMQIMGDWAKGEFTAAGKKAGVDYVCVAAPDTASGFTFNIDSFVMFDLFDQGSDSSVKAQADLARLIMEPTFQTAFNLNKGSIPVRQDIDRAPFDSCATSSMDSFKASADSNNLVPSFAHGMATTSRVQGAIFDVVTNFYNSKDQSAKAAADKLARAVKASI